METHGPNGEYERAYREWVAGLSSAELDELKRNGLHKPLHDACMGTPDYERILDIAHDDPAPDDDPPDIHVITDAGERLAMILLFLADSKNPRLNLFVLMWVLGFTSMVGLSQEEIAAKFGLSKAAFSKPCKLMQHRFRLPPNRAMKQSTEYRWTNGAMPPGQRQPNEL